MQPISRTRPGHAATTFLAPATDTALHPPTAGIRGAAYPPNPVAADEQHFICAGPGHRPDLLLRPQSLCQRQLPALVLAHEALVQHFMLAASAGQAPEMLVPPEEVQALLLMQTPVGGGSVSCCFGGG